MPWPASMDGFAPGTNQGEGYKRFQQVAKNLHEISEKFFFWKSVEGLTDTIDMKSNFAPNTMRDVMALRMGRTVAKIIRGHVPDARLAQMLDHFCQYVGSSPYLAPAVLCSIGDMQASEGIWYPKGGTRAVAEGLANLAGSLGADLRPGVEVTGFEVENGTMQARCGPRPASGSPAMPSSPTWTPSAPTRSWWAARSARNTPRRASSRPVPAWCSTSG